MLCRYLRFGKTPQLSRKSVFVDEFVALYCTYLYVYYIYTLYMFCLCFDFGHTFFLLPFVLQSLASNYRAHVPNDSVQIRGHSQAFIRLACRATCLLPLHQRRTQMKSFLCEVDVYALGYWGEPRLCAFSRWTKEAWRGAAQHQHLISRSRVAGCMSRTQGLKRWSAQGM